MNTITEEEMNELISKSNNELVLKLMKSEFFTPIRTDSHGTAISTVSDDFNVFMKLFDCIDDCNATESMIPVKRLSFGEIFAKLKNSVDGFIIRIDSSEFILDENFIAENIMPAMTGSGEECQ